MYPCQRTPISDRLEDAVKSRFNTYFDCRDGAKKNIKQMTSGARSADAVIVADFCRFHKISADWLYGLSNRREPFPSQKPGDIAHRLWIASGCQKQAAMINDTGVYQSTMSAVMRGARECKMNVVEAFSNAYGVSYDYILGIPLDGGTVEEPSDSDGHEQEDEAPFRLDSSSFSFVLYKGDDVIGCFDTIEDVAEYIGCSVGTAKRYSYRTQRIYENEMLEKHGSCSAWIIERVSNYD